MARTYRVRTGFGYPVDDLIRTRIRAGERLSFEARGQIREVIVGTLVDDLPDDLFTARPDESVPWLIADGVLELEPVDDAPSAPLPAPGEE